MKKRRTTKDVPGTNGKVAVVKVATNGWVVELYDGYASAATVVACLTFGRVTSTVRNHVAFAASRLTVETTAQRAARRLAGRPPRRVRR
jgi:hypothetical protein